MVCAVFNGFNAATLSELHSGFVLQPSNQPSQCQHGVWRRVPAGIHTVCVLPTNSINSIKYN